MRKKGFSLISALYLLFTIILYTISLLLSIIVQNIHILSKTFSIFHIFIYFSLIVKSRTIYLL